jgi:hypothetical protein
LKNDSSFFNSNIYNSSGGESQADHSGVPGSIPEQFVWDLYALPNTVRVINSRKKRSTRLVTRVIEIRNSYRSLFVKPEGKRPLT